MEKLEGPTVSMALRPNGHPQGTWCTTLTPSCKQRPLSESVQMHLDPQEGEATEVVIKKTQRQGRGLCRTSTPPLIRGSSTTPGTILTG